MIAFTFEFIETIVAKVWDKQTHYKGEIKMTKAVETNPRILNAYEGFVKHMKNFLDEQQFNHEEYTNFVNWADRLGRSGEIPLFLDVFVETYVLEAKYKNSPGTEPSLLGPYYEEDSPLLEGSKVVIPQRPDEPGDKINFLEMSVLSMDQLEKQKSNGGRMMQMACIQTMILLHQTST